MTVRYEVELRELICRDDGGEPGIAGWAWEPVTVFRADAIPAPLTFDSLGAARAYAGRSHPDSVRIVRVTDDGGREVVDTIG